MAKQISAVISAGGFGTRMREAFPEIPKPLIMVDDKAIIIDCIERLSLFSVNDIHILLHHKSDKIINEVEAAFKESNLKIHYHIEESPLGSGGGLRLVLDKLTQNFLL